MRLDVIFTPASLHEPEGAVCVVIDALRATSTLVARDGTLWLSAGERRR